MHSRIRILTLLVAGVSICGCTANEPELSAKTLGIPPEWQGMMGTPAVAYDVGADDYGGKRIRWSAWVKGRALVGPIAGLWMRVDGAGVVTGYDNMSNRAKTGTTDWHQVSIVLDVPVDALGIQVGAMRLGGGVLFIDDIKLEIVGTDVPTTNQFSAPLANTIDPAVTVAEYLGAARTPRNTDFERLP